MNTHHQKKDRKAEYVEEEQTNVLAVCVCVCVCGCAFVCFCVVGVLYCALALVSRASVPGCWQQQQQ